MNDHNLDDLIINDMEPKNSKTKSFLTILALLIVVLIVAIILTKIILKDPNADQFAIEENNTEMISPELTLQSVAKKTPKKEETELSNIIESQLNTPAPVEEIRTETVEIIETPIPVAQVSEAKKDAADRKKEEARLQEEENNKIRIAKLEQDKAEEAAKLEREKRAEAEAVKKRTQKEAVKPIPKEIIQQAKVKPASRPVSKPVKPKATSSKTYYIQVGSFTKTPSKQFLGIITRSGFKYRITPKASNGTKKLLIGPYNNRTSANNALPRVKDRINKNAYVVKR